MSSTRISKTGTVKYRHKCACGKRQEIWLFANGECHAFTDDEEEEEGPAATSALSAPTSTELPTVIVESLPPPTPPTAAVQQNSIPDPLFELLEKGAQIEKSKKKQTIKWEAEDPFAMSMVQVKPPQPLPKPLEFNAPAEPILGEHIRVHNKDMWVYLNYLKSISVAADDLRKKSK